MASAGNVLRHIWAWRTVLILFLAPIMLCPVPIVLDSKKADCAYVVMLMAVYWITEALPVGVTALLPVVLFPMFEVLSSSAVAAEYMNDTNMLFLGGLVMAIAIEYWNLHKRVAIKILMLVGSEPRWLMLGMMSATWFLSIWISNTATTAMMIPIAEAVLVQIKENNFSKKTDIPDVEKQGSPVRNGTAGVMESNRKLSEPKLPEIIVVSQTDKQNKDEVNEKGRQGDTTDIDEDPVFRRLCKGMSLSICYSANSGGIASLTGTGPNLVMKAHSDTIYHQRGLTNPVTFGTWLGYGFPLSFLVLILCWVWLQVAFVRCSGSSSCFAKNKDDAKQKSNNIKESLREEYKKLGPIVTGQAIIIFLFLFLITLWITRDLGGVAGWGQLFDPPIKDGAAAILVTILLFTLPSTFPCLKSYSDPVHPAKWERENMKTVDKELATAGPLEIQPLLHWKVVHERMPWHLFLLLGGGYAMSKACVESGLSEWIGDQLQVFEGWNQWAVLLIICYVTAAGTEVMSNSAIATLFMPIMSQLAISTGVHPLVYMYPVSMACSFAFMLPVSTAPNAIVFAYGRVTVLDMAIAGFILNVFAVPLLVGMTASLGNAIFDFDTVPPQFLNDTVAPSLSSA